MKRLRAALVIAAGAALSRTDCSLGAFCAQGEAGCVDPGCHDGARGGDETDVDCGGSCGPCGVAEACAVPADCATGRCVQGRCCEAPCGLWASSFGSLGYDAATDVVIAPDGSIYVAGAFSGIVDFGGGPLASAGATDAFVMKLDAGGEHLWSTRFGGPLDDGSTVSLALTAAGHPVIAITSANESLDLGGGPLTGTTSSNLYVVELDAAGEHVWSRAYTGSIDVARIAVAPDGDLVLSGAFWNVDLGAAGHLVSKGSNDILLARLDPAGEPRWAKGWGNLWGDIGRRVAVGTDGAIYIEFVYSLSSSLGGKALPNSKGEFSIGVARFDGDGVHRWSRGWVNGSSHSATGLAVDDHGAVWLSGVVKGSLDVGTGPLPAAIGTGALVVKLDAESGATLWAHSYGEHTMAAQGIVPDGHGGVIVSGVYEGNADFGGGVTLGTGTGQPFIARLDAAGGAIWARAVEGVGVVTTLAATPGGDRLVLAGGHRGTLDVGTGPLPSGGDVDAFVAGLVP